MTMHVFGTNIASSDSRAMCIIFALSPACPLPLWRAATCHVGTLLPGPEGVRSRQVLL